MYRQQLFCHIGSHTDSISEGRITREGIIKSVDRVIDTTNFRYYGYRWQSHLPRIGSVLPNSYHPVDWLVGDLGLDYEDDFELDGTSVVGIDIDDLDDSFGYSFDHFQQIAWSPGSNLIILGSKSQGVDDEVGLPDADAGEVLLRNPVVLKVFPRISRL